MEFEGRRYAIVLFCIGKAYDQTPALSRVFLQQLGFPLPEAAFQDPLRDEYWHLADLALKRQPVLDQPGRHTPPMGRAKSEPSARKLPRPDVAPEPRGSPGPAKRPHGDVAPEPRGAPDAAGAGAPEDFVIVG